MVLRNVLYNFTARYNLGLQTAHQRNVAHFCLLAGFNTVLHRHCNDVTVPP